MARKIENKIEDFGEKIFGARKDLARIRNGLIELTEELIGTWSENEQKEFITKDLVWKRPDYQSLIDSGIDRKVVYAIKLIRDAIPPKPTFSVMRTEEGRKGYAEFVRDVSKKVMEIKNMSDFKELGAWMKTTYLTRDYGHYYKANENTYGCFNTKLLRTLEKSEALLEREVAKKEFCYDKNDKLIKEYIKDVFSPSEYLDTEYARNEGLYSNYGEVILTKKESYGTSRKYVTIKENGKCPESLSKEDFKENLFYVVSRTGNELIVRDVASKEEALKLALEWAKTKDAEKGENEKEESPVKKGRKEKLLPPSLKYIIRTGDEYRTDNKNIEGNDILNVFALRGGQFGNWTNQNDRQTNMNMAFDALADLCIALDIDFRDVSLNDGEENRTSSLALAWGARGRGNALAHYEPLENVINLTKMRGAGSLGHEWGHALDAFVKVAYDLKPSYDAQKSQIFLATHCQKENNPFAKVIEAMRWKEGDDGRRCATSYYTASQKADGQYARTDNGYWASNCEMFARAFACYVKDKLTEKGIRSDYLVGHADSCVYPRGEERETINKAIDGLVTELKEKGFLHHLEHSVTLSIHSIIDAETAKEVSEEQMRALEEKTEETEKNITEIPKEETADISITEPVKPAEEPVRATDRETEFKPYKPLTKEEIRQKWAQRRQRQAEREER